MFTSIATFKSVWDMETAATLSCFDKLTDESLSKELFSDYRTIGRLVNHIVDCVISIPHEAGVPASYTKETYSSIQTLVDAYKSNTKKSSGSFISLDR